VWSCNSSDTSFSTNSPCFIDANSAGGALSKLIFSGGHDRSKPVTVEVGMTEADFSGAFLQSSGAMILAAWLEHKVQNHEQTNYCFGLTYIFDIGHGGVGFSQSREQLPRSPRSQAHRRSAPEMVQTHIALCSSSFSHQLFSPIFFRTAFSDMFISETLDTRDSGALVSLNLSKNGLGANYKIFAEVLPEW
jgi:hypothetical protein